MCQHYIESVQHSLIKCLAYLVVEVKHIAVSVHQLLSAEKSKCLQLS